MTFRELQKLIQSESGPEQSQLFRRLRDKPFWIWDPKQHKQEDISNNGKESKEPDYDEDQDQLEEKQEEETGEVRKQETTNQIF